MLKFIIKPMSVNSMYFRNRKYNTEARAYRTNFLEQLQSDCNQSYLDSIKSKFDKNKHYLSISFIFHIPKNKFFTKKGYISRNSMDLDNRLKPIIDFICSAKYNDRGYVNLDIDDQFIGELSALKRPSINDEYQVFISLEVKPLSCLEV